MSNLTNKKIESFFEKGVYVDGNGLRLRVDKNKNKSWSLRYQLAGKVREMGLGKYPIISLKDARKKMIDAKKMIYDGKDPLEIRKEIKTNAKTKGILYWLSLCRTNVLPGCAKYLS